jgi:hypothetical protein
MSEVDGDKLNGRVGRMLGDLGGAFSVPTVRIVLKRRVRRGQADLVKLVAAYATPLTA